jgi:hypothetical protein
MRAGKMARMLRPESVASCSEVIRAELNLRVEVPSR